MRLHPGVLCVAFCTGCSCRWRAWLCARDARRISRSSCSATNSQSCAGRTTAQRSPTRTGPCWVPSQRPCPDRSELAGSSHQRLCCVGIDAESPAIGSNPAGRPGGPTPLWSFAATRPNYGHPHPPRHPHSDLKREEPHKVGVEELHCSRAPASYDMPAERFCGSTNSGSLWPTARFPSTRRVELFLS